MIIRDIRLEGTNVIVRASGTYAEMEELGASVPRHQEDRLVDLDLIVYSSTLEKLDTCRHLTVAQKRYVHELYNATVVAKGELHASMAQI